MLQHTECPICIELLCDPIQLPCKHVFCRSCVVRAFKVRSQLCPVCRACASDFNPALEPTVAEVEQQLSLFYREELEQRRRETAARREHSLRLRICNRTDFKPGKSWENPCKWTVVVNVDDPSVNTQQHSPSSTSNDTIESVRFIVQPCCQLVDKTSGELVSGPALCRGVDVAEEPFEVTGISWGLFTVRMRVFFKESLQLPPVDVQHRLSLRDGGATIYDIEYTHAAGEINVVLNESHVPHPTSFEALLTCNEQPHGSATAPTGRRFLPRAGIKLPIWQKAKNFICGSQGVACKPSLSMVGLGR